MCIIVYKEKGTPVKIDWDILKTCFENNPDGAGYAIAYDNKLILRKGFMRFLDFQQSFESATKHIKLKDAGILLHFRITTHGGTNKENTHPFAIGCDDTTKSKYKDLDCAVAMNGICLSNMGYKDKLSDTADAVKNVINPIYNMFGEFWQKEQSKTLFKFLGAKWAFLQKDGKVFAFGDFNQRAGWNYSNYSYMSYTKSVYSYDIKDDYICDSYTSYYNDKLDSYTNYSLLGLTPFKGVLENIETLELLEIEGNDVFFIDDENFLYSYDWESDDFYITDEYSILQNDTWLELAVVD